MNTTLVALGAACLALLAEPAPEPAPAPAPRPVVADFQRPVATYSIVARDPNTGEIGVAVQSHWFSVGSVVPWAEPGVGAVATQSLVDVRYGPEGLRLLREGKSAQEALDLLLADDPNPEVRQVAIVDALGRIAVHTGDRCIQFAGHDGGTSRDGAVYSVQANLMARPEVPEVMKVGFESLPEGTPLAERLVAALAWAEVRGGGDVRGKQSAAVLVVSANKTDTPWKERLVELRVEDHPEPVDELRRLLKLHRAYEHMNKGDHAMEQGDTDAALHHFSEARRLNPTNAEMAFWAAVSMINAGKIEEAERLLSQAYADGSGDWRTTLRRLPASGLLPDDPELIDRLARLPEAK